MPLTTRRTSALNQESPKEKIMASNKAESKSEKAKDRETDRSKEADKMKDADKSKAKERLQSSEIAKDSLGENEGQKQKAEQSDVSGEIRKLRQDLKLMLGEMDERMSVRLKTIDDKFTNMFKDIRRELREEMGSLKDEMEETKTNMKAFSDKVDGIEKSVQFHSEKVDEVEKQQDKKLKDATSELNDRIHELDDKLKLLEKHDRKYNLLFYGFTEERNENVYDMLRESFRADLGIDEQRVSAMYFSNGHRIPSKSPGPKPIILRFTSFDDKELVLSLSYKYAGTRRRVLVDLPEDMKRERSRLAKKAYEIRRSEEKKTRIKDKGLEVYLEVRNGPGDAWEKRVV